MVDLFNGDAVSMPPKPGFDLFKWINEGFDGKNPHTVEAIDPIVVEGIKTLKSYGINKIGAVAYCFGAKVRFLCLSLPRLPKRYRNCRRNIANM